MRNNVIKILMIIAGTLFILGCGDNYTAEGDMNVTRQAAKSAVQVNPDVEVKTDVKADESESLFYDRFDQEVKELKDEIGAIKIELKRLADDCKNIPNQDAEELKSELDSVKSDVDRLSDNCKEIFSKQEKLVEELDKIVNNKSDDGEDNTLLTNERNMTVPANRTKLLDLTYITKTDWAYTYTDEMLYDNLGNVYNFGIGFHLDGSIEYICEGYKTLEGKAVINSNMKNIDVNAMLAITDENGNFLCDPVSIKRGDEPQSFLAKLDNVHRLKIEYTDDKGYGNYSWIFLVDLYLNP